MSTINYVVGDATYPQGPGPKVIAHCVNDIGKWGSGFVLALNKRWLKPREEYLAWSREINPVIPFKLGSVQLVQVEPELWVANIIGQHQTIRENPKPIRYEALARGLWVVADFSLTKKASVVMPRLGAGLARGRWDIIEKIIQEELVDRGVSTTVYDLP